jgi:hypothetical protein
MQFLPKSDDQTEHEYINDLVADCLQLHIFAKAETIQALDEKKSNRCNGILS